MIPAIRVTKPKEVPETGPQRLQNPHQDPAEHRSGDIADAPEDGRCERLDARDKAHVVLDRAVIHPVQEARGPSQSAADQKGESDDPVHGDPHEGGRLLVLGAGAHGFPEPGAHDKQLKDHHQRDGHKKDQDLQAAQ